MTKVEQLEREIEALTPEERSSFREWFSAFDAAEWDAQFDRDATSGALDKLADAALAEHRAGRSRPL